MSHAKSLRVIGQSLEVANLLDFDLHTDGLYYVVRTNHLSKAGERSLRQALSSTDISVHETHPPTVSMSVRFSPTCISRLDNRAQKQRRISSYLRTQAYNRLSQLLRALGHRLDQIEVNTFHVSWMSNSASVDFQVTDGQSDCRTFTAAKLEQLGSHSRFRRSRRTT